MNSKPNFLILMVDQLTGTFWQDGPAAFLHAPGQSLVAAALGDEDADPQELSNLARTPVHADTLAHFTAMRKARWNLDNLDEDIRDNQQRRIVCYEALREGRYTAWDHQPVLDASQRFMRNHLDLNDVEAGNRVPVRPETPPMNHGSN